MKPQSKKKKRVIDPLKLEQIQFNNAVRSVFMQGGFSRLPVNGVEFTFRGRTGELDDAFLFENILVLCEYTIGKTSTSHIGKKKFLFDEILNNSAEWVEALRGLSADFDEAYIANNYDADDFRVKIVYCSKKGVNEEILHVYPQILYLDFPQIKYL